MSAPAIEIVCCGGTIDKIYFDAESSYQVGEPAATAIVARARIHRPPRIVSLLRKDSLEMDDDDRARLAAHLLASTARRFVVAHGTDTMADSARCLEAAGLAVAGKTAVLAGAFAPAIFRETDADFNLGFALGAARFLPAGAFVAMNGEIFTAAEVVKNRAAGRFETARQV